MGRRVRRRRPKARVLWAVAAAASAAGCVESVEQPGDAVEEGDRPRATLRLREPSVVLGDGPTAVERVHDVAAAFRLSDGRFVVVDGGSREIRFFGSDGAHERSAGGEGDGPGEFRDIGSAARIRGDSVAVWDPGLGRMTVFGPEGQLADARTVTISPRGGPGWITQDGVLVHAPSPGESYGVDGSILHRQTFLFVRDPVTGAADTIGPVAGTEIYAHGRSRLLRRFGTRLIVEVDGRTVLVGSGKGPLRRYSTHGELIERIGLPLGARPVTEAAKEEALDVALQGGAEARRATIESALASMPYPDSIPTYRDLRVDRLGRIWVRAFSIDDEAPQRWLTVDDAEPLEAELQGGSTLLDVGPDWLLLLERDTLGVEYVVVHPFERVGGIGG